MVIEPIVFVCLCAHLLAYTDIMQLYEYTIINNIIIIHVYNTEVKILFSVC